MNNDPIGVFDSGVGGLSCVPAIAKALPNEQIIYFGDCLNAPYGTRSREEIARLSCEVADKLLKMNCKSLSIACNTISCNALEELKAFTDVPIIGIVEPAKEDVVKQYPDKRIGVIATPATIKSRAYESVCCAARACPDFVVMVESGRSDEKVIRENLDAFIKDNGLEVLILGCTHFPFLADDISGLYPELILFDPAKSLANKTYEALKAVDLLADFKQAENIYISSCESKAFDSIVERIK